MCWDDDGNGDEADVTYNLTQILFYLARHKLCLLKGKTYPGDARRENEEKSEVVRPMPDCKRQCKCILEGGGLLKLKRASRVLASNGARCWRNSSIQPNHFTKLCGAKHIMLATWGSIPGLYAL